MRHASILIVIALLYTGNVKAEEPTIIRIASRINQTSDDLPPIVSVGSENHTEFVQERFEYIEEDASVDSNSSSPTETCKNWLRHSLAGFPKCVKSNARCSYDSRYKAYYVGGGTPFDRRGCLGGDCRRPHEGTFGVDYAPWYSRVNLRWSHGVLFQGGTGEYETDRKNVPLGLRYGRDNECSE